MRPVKLSWPIGNVLARSAGTAAMTLAYVTSCVGEREMVPPNFGGPAYGRDSWLVPWTQPTSDGITR